MLISTLVFSEVVSVAFPGLCSCDLRVWKVRPACSCLILILFFCSKKWNLWRSFTILCRRILSMNGHNYSRNSGMSKAVSLQYFVHKCVILQKYPGHQAENVSELSRADPSLAVAVLLQNKPLQCQAIKFSCFQHFPGKWRQQVDGQKRPVAWKKRRGQKRGEHFTGSIIFRNVNLSSATQFLWNNSQTYHQSVPEEETVLFLFHPQHKPCFIVMQCTIKSAFLCVLWCFQASDKKGLKDRRKSARPTDSKTKGEFSPSLFSPNDEQLDEEKIWRGKQSVMFVCLFVQVLTKLKSTRHQARSKRKSAPQKSKRPVNRRKQRKKQFGWTSIFSPNVSSW